MNGIQPGGSNRKQRRAKGDKGAALKDAKDAYVTACGIAHTYGSDSPEFETGFAEFEAAHARLTRSQVGAFDFWQGTHIVAQNRETGNLEAVAPGSMKRPDDQVCDPDVFGWFREIDAGVRAPVVKTVPLMSIRSNPYILQFDDELIEGAVTLLRGQQMEEWLVVASLPDGSFIDVDSPYPCEALKREGRELVEVTIIGSFDEEKCSELGLLPWVDMGGVADV